MYFLAKSEGTYRARRAPAPKESEVLIMSMYMHFILSTLSFI